MQSRKKYFINHPSINTMFFTSDDLAFIQKGEADSHALSLENKKVVEVSREDAMAEKDGKEVDPKDALKKDADNAVKQAGKAVDAAGKEVGKKKTAVEGKTKAVENAKNEEKKLAAETALGVANEELKTAEAALVAANEDLKKATDAREALDEPAA